MKYLSINYSIIRLINYSINFGESLGDNLIHQMLIIRDMVKHELQVESLKARVESLKARVEIKSVSSNPRVPSSNPRVTSSNLRVTSSNPRVTSSNPQIIKSIVRQFVRQLVRSVSGDDLLFYVSTTPWLRLQQEAE